MKKQLKNIFAVSLLVSLFVTGCVGSSYGTANGVTGMDGSGSFKVLTIGTADSGGTMYPVGKAIAQTISDLDSKIKVNISASGGSSFNVRSLEKGEIDMGLVSGDVAFSAVNGQDEFEGAPAKKLCTLAAVYPSLSNWMVPSSSGITWVHDLKGKRLGVGPQDSTTELSARALLETLGISPENSTLVNCGLGSGAADVRKGNLDAIHGFTGVPISGLQDLADSVDCRLLKYTDEELRAILRTNSFYYSDVIPAGTYIGQREDIPTFGIKCLLCVSEDMDEELAYELTSILWNASSSLGEAHPSLAAMEWDGFMYRELPIELHPGAVRFYQEKGLLETPLPKDR